jgi:hypothetical protein
VSLYSTYKISRHDGPDSATLYVHMSERWEVVLPIIDSRIPEYETHLDGPDFIEGNLVSCPPSVEFDVNGVGRVPHTYDASRYDNPHGAAVFWSDLDALPTKKEQKHE